jgi:hypothetical protein
MYSEADTERSDRSPFPLDVELAHFDTASVDLCPLDPGTIGRPLYLAFRSWWMSGCRRDSRARCINKTAPFVEVRGESFAP